MIGKEQSRRLAITVSSGSGTGTVSNSWDIARRIRIIPPTEATTYVCEIKDANGYHIFKTPDVQTGHLSMLNEMSLGIVKTVEISSASVDGEFLCLFDMH